MSIIYDVRIHQGVQKILSNWSKTLELDDLSGESIVTSESLDRLGTILTRYFKETIGQIQFPNNPIAQYHNNQ